MRSTEFSPGFAVAEQDATRSDSGPPAAWFVLCTRLLVSQTWMVEDGGVAGGALDRHAKQCADAPQVTAVGADFVEDAVGADVAGCDAQHESRPVGADGFGAQCGAVVDEHVRVGCVRPVLGAVVQVGSESYVDRFGEQDGAAGQVHAAVNQSGAGNAAHRS